MLNKHNLVAGLAYLVSFLLQSPAAHAQVAVETIPNLEAAGYALMDDINTPLLHRVATGAGYDLRVLAWATGEVNALMPGLDKEVRSKAANKDEFVRHDVFGSWGGFVASRVEVMKNAHSYLIPLRTNWQEYNFSTHRYRAQFSMRMQNKRANSSFHCDGAFQEVKHEYLTSCLTATNLNAGDSWLHSFPVDDVQLARNIKENPDLFRVYGVAKPNGKYQVMRGREIAFISNREFETYIAAGVQPVKIVNLALVDRKSGDIYAFARPFESDQQKLASAEGSINSTEVSPPGATSLASSSSQPTSRWSKYYGDDQIIFYADPNSIKREGDVVVVRELEDIVKIGPDKVASKIGIYSYNCAKRSWRLLAEKSYAEHMGMGTVLRESTGTKDPRPVEQGTVAVNALNNACNAPHTLN